jgi:hypothetical protein
MNKTLKAVGVVIFSGVLLISCAGRAANPVAVHQYGDKRKSCKALEHEIAFIEQEIQRLIPKTEKTGKNVALGITGFFLIVPWFFMDLSKAEQIEVNALRQRHNHLVILSEEKECGLEKKQIPDFQQPTKEKKQDN